MMLSRIANSLFDLGQSVERAQHVAQILEVNHKMNLERSADDEPVVWKAISAAFDGDPGSADERSLYEQLVLSSVEPYSVRHCVGRARFEGRAMREHISEEMWLHLNHTHLAFDTLTFESILSMGRSEFNRSVKVFSDALSGLADDTMIRGEAWAFLKMGKLAERASMICKILKIKEGSIAPEHGGDPVDVHQWQALLRSLSGYEPYRRAYDARILPNRVLEFVLKRRDFPRSLAGCLVEMRAAAAMIPPGCDLFAGLDPRIVRLLDHLAQTRTEALIEDGSFASYLDELTAACEEIEKTTQLAFVATQRMSPLKEVSTSHLEFGIPQ